MHQLLTHSLGGCIIPPPRPHHICTKPTMPPMAILTLIRSFCSFFFLFIILSTPSAYSSPTVKIGYITDLSGIGAFFGIQTQRGAKLARDELLANGGSLQVIFEDSRGKTSDGVTAVIRLLELEKVDAVICDLTSICTAISPKVKASNKVLIYHTPATSIRETNSLAFRNFLDYKASCKAIAQAWHEQNLEPMGSLMPHLEFGELCLEGIKVAAPTHFTFRYNPGDDLRTAVLLFKSHGIKSVIHVGYENDFLAWFKFSTEQAFHPVQGFMDIMLSQKLLNTSGRLLEGATVSGYQEVPESFLNLLQEKYPSKDKFNIQGAALAYNAVRSMYSALIRCPDKSTQCMLSALKDPPPSKLLGFRGFGNTEEYPVALKEFRSGSLRAG